MAKQYMEVTYKDAVLRVEATATQFNQVVALLIHNTPKKYTKEKLEIPQQQRGYKTRDVAQYGRDKAKLLEWYNHCVSKGFLGQPRGKNKYRNAKIEAEKFNLRFNTLNAIRTAVSVTKKEVEHGKFE